MTISSLLNHSIARHYCLHGENPRVIFVSKYLVQGLFEELISGEYRTDEVFDPTQFMKYGGINLIEMNSFHGITAMTLAQ